MINKLIYFKFFFFVSTVRFQNNWFRTKLEHYKIGYSIKNNKKKFSYNLYTNSSLQNFDLSTFISQKETESNKLVNVETGGNFNYKYNSNLLISSSFIFNYYNSFSKPLEQNFSISPVVLDLIYKKIFLLIICIT